MPGLENGSSFENAFTWDHTHYPGGTRVLGATTNYGAGGNTQDWWALYLLAGQTYVFQTRNPTAWDTNIYLYNPDASPIMGDADSGDDGHGLSKITYTPSKEGWYRLTVWGYYYYGQYGPYVLESVPAPKSFRTFSFVPSRIASLAATAATVPSRFEAVKDKIAAMQAARHEARARLTLANASRFSTRAARARAVVSRFEAVKAATIAGVASRLDSRAGMGARTVARFDVRALREAVEPVRFDIRQITNAAVPSRWAAYGHMEAAIPARHSAFVPPGWAVYARNTASNEAMFLGSIPADASPKQLVDVLIHDGVWEIEVRPSQWFWHECRGRKVVTLVTDPAGGAGEPIAGLPAIQNLRREIVGFQSVLKWSVAAEYAPGAFEFGLWFGPSSPVDTSGPPAVTVPYVAGQGEYQVVRVQTAAEHVAVAAFTDDDMGSVSELHTPWNTVAPASPPNQSAYEEVGE